MYGIKEPTRMHQSCNLCQILKFGGYLKVRKIHGLWIDTILDHINRREIHLGVKILAWHEGMTISKIQIPSKIHVLLLSNDNKSSLCHP